MVDRPLPLGVFVCEGQQGFSKIGKPRNEFPIEIAESNERSDCFYVDRGGPVLDSVKFGGVHFDGSTGGEKSEVFDFGGVEGAFGKLESETLCTKSLQDASGSFLVENKVIR